MAYDFRWRPGGLYFIAAPELSLDSFRLDPHDTVTIQFLDDSPPWTEEELRALDQIDQELRRRDQENDDRGV